MPVIPAALVSFVSNDSPLLRQLWHVRFIIHISVDNDWFFTSPVDLRRVIHSLLHTVWPRFYPRVHYPQMPPFCGQWTIYQKEYAEKPRCNQHIVAHYEAVHLHPCLSSENRFSVLKRVESRRFIVHRDKCKCLTSWLSTLSTSLLIILSSLII